MPRKVPKAPGIDSLEILSIADDTGDDQIGVVKDSTIGMAERIPQLSTLVDATRCLGGNVGRNAAGETELLEEPLDARFVPRDVRIDLAVGAFEVDVRNDAGPAVPRSRDVQDAQLAFADRAIEVNVNQVQSGGRSPVPE